MTAGLRLTLIIWRKISERYVNLHQNPQNFLRVVKADAYGHGAVMLAPTLLASGADMLGVASIDEGADLRNAKNNGGYPCFRSGSCLGG